MGKVAARDLRNETRASPFSTRSSTVEARPEFTPRAEFVRAVIGRQADPELAATIQALAPDTTDDLPNL